MNLFVLCWMPRTLLAERHSASGIQGQAVVSSDVGLDDTIFGGSPVQAHIRVLTAEGRLLASFTTNPDGSFRVALLPGDYVLIPDESSNPYLVAIPTAVTVHKKEFATTTVGYYDQPL